MRVKRGVTTHAKHAKIRKETKGMQKSRRASFRLGKQAVIKSLQYQYRDRRNKKRTMRSLWIIRINAALRGKNISYSKFFYLINKSKIAIDRKILAELAVNEPAAFDAVVTKITNNK